MNQRVVAGAAAVVALVIGIWGALFIAPPSSGNGPDTQYFQAYPQPRALSAVDLVDQHGDAFTEANLQGHWTLVFLGYTFCPDICPTTMAALNSVYPQLTAIPTDKPLQVLFISVDPNRDSTERLAEYVKYFNPAFIAATGEHKVLFPLARSMGMMYVIAESTDNPNYLVDHSASVVVINPQAQVIGRFKPELLPGKLAVSDVEQIVADMPAIMHSE